MITGSSKTHFCFKCANSSMGTRPPLNALGKCAEEIHTAIIFAEKSQFRVQSSDSEWNGELLTHPRAERNCEVHVAIIVSPDRHTHPPFAKFFFAVQPIENEGLPFRQTLW
jgi:hypothetical protein